MVGAALAPRVDQKPISTPKPRRASKAGRGVARSLAVSRSDLATALDRAATMVRV